MKGKIKMKYLAHRDQESEREQSLIDHLEKTAELAGQYAEAFGAYQWGYCAGLLHDIGKYSQEFRDEFVEVRNR